jgi:hypothetical protein
MGKSKVVPTQKNEFFKTKQANMAFCVVKQSKKRQNGTKTNYYYLSAASQQFSLIAV